jgi:exodeoxyribonuclease VII large subunit
MSEIVPYNPSSLVNVFNNVLNADTTRKVFRIKGVYVPGKGMNYGGVFFDSLKDEYSDATITLIVPALIRVNLQAQQLIECSAYLTKKVQLNGARIELQVNVTEVHSQEQSKLTDEQIKAFEILQKKATIGYKDVDSFMKTRIIQQEPITVTIIIGRTGIIDSDIKHQLKDAIAFYNLEFVRISLTSETEIIASLLEHDEDTDILVVSRGGGENMNVFNKPSLAEAALELDSYFVTAIGHKEDFSLLQKVADKHFITPTALGQYFHDIYTQTIEELQDSKAKLVEDISKQYKTNYEMQLQNLNDKLRGARELNEKQVALKQEQIESLQKQLTEKKSIHVVIWLLLILVAIIGVFIGKGCN